MSGSINIYLESEYADIRLNDAHLIWDLASPIFIPEDITAQVALTNFYIPNSMYIIDNNNNKLVISTGGTTYTITLTDGNYNANEFDTELETRANAAFTAGGAGTTVLTVTYEGATNKYTFRIQTGGVDTNWVIETATTCFKEIGVTGGVQYNYNGTQILPNQVDLGGTPNIFVKCLNLYTSNRTTEGAISNTLAKIPVTVPPLGYVYMEQKEPIYFDITNRVIKNIDIDLQNQRFQDLILGGVSWGLTLTFRFKDSSLLREEEL